jgi:hypothetical protein
MTDALQKARAPSAPIEREPGMEKEKRTAYPGAVFWKSWASLPAGYGTIPWPGVNLEPIAAWWFIPFAITVLLIS